MIFYIDTSSSYLYTAIYKKHSIINSKSLNLSKDLSTFTVDEVSKMFDEVKVKPMDIDKIMVVNGPGSFTGIRIGVTLAKIYAYCLHKKIITITSLEAMAKSVDTNKVIVPIIDARREACYAAIYDNNQIVMEGRYLKIEELFRILHDLGREYVFVSNDKFSFETLKYAPDYQKIIENFMDRESINPHIVNPDYLKLTEAEENKERES